MVTDAGKVSMGNLFFRAGLALGADAVLVVMSERTADGQEPPAAVAAAMAAADVVIAPTTRSLTHTAARRRATDAGARVATMPGITEDMLYRGAITADYEVVRRRTEQVARILDGGRAVRLISGEKYELFLDITGRRAIASTGVYRDPGSAGNLPSGEAYLAPVEGSANGDLFVDGSVAGLGLLQDPLLLHIENGRLVSAEGPDAERLLKLLDQSPQGRMVAELGIGTNDAARLTGTVLEDEKIYGTVHIAFGSNASFGGSIEAGLHIDAVVLRPQLYVDGVLLVGDGRVYV
ncbi:aminopeptidase [Thermaerobacter sp. PB12/4term]|uniref:aminopeptidase n=1 Tax=Thermaerobacter sp. PB12/4term TaxID=2293838 RepID=UPI001FAC37CD|nr:aminopeptidase [Thermaerobacter sp. PB12/4term]